MDDSLDHVAPQGDPRPVDAAELLDAALPPPMSLNVRLDPDTGLVRLDFSRPTGSVSMEAEAARQMAEALRRAANDADRATGRRNRPNGRRGRW